MKKIIVSCFLLLFALGCTNKVVEARQKFPCDLIQLHASNAGSVFLMKYDGEEYILYTFRQGVAITKK